MPLNSSFHPCSRHMKKDIHAQVWKCNLRFQNSLCTLVNAKTSWLHHYQVAVRYYSSSKFTNEIILEFIIALQKMVCWLKNFLSALFILIKARFSQFPLSISKRLHLYIYHFQHSFRPFHKQVEGTKTTKLPSVTYKSNLVNTNTNGKSSDRFNTIAIENEGFDGVDELIRFLELLGRGTGAHGCWRSRGVHFSWWTLLNRTPSNKGSKRIKQWRVGDGMDFLGQV